MLRTVRLLPATILVATMGIAVTACASQTYGYQGGSYRQVERRAYDLGYREGVSDGQADVQRGVPPGIPDRLQRGV